MATPRVDLLGQTYLVARDHAGLPLVLVQRGAQWRDASPGVAVKILAGLSVEVLAGARRKFTQADGDQT